MGPIIADLDVLVKEKSLLLQHMETNYQPVGSCLSELAKLAYVQISRNQIGSLG
jgi:hypothetical protein